MRIYLPATLADLSAPDISARTAFAATDRMIAHYDVTQEECEALALDDAALACLALLASTPDADAHPRRLVLAADVPDSALTLHPHTPADDLTLGAVNVSAPISWSDIVAFFLDDVEGESFLRTAVFAPARDGDDAMPGQVPVEDLPSLLWYDVTERDAIIVVLRAEGALT